MSLVSWKKEFYPVPAKEVSKRDAAAHSLQKWLGLREASLQKHGAALCSADDYWSSRNVIVDESGDRLYVNCASCALCVWFLGKNAVTSSEACSRCPLSKVRGGIPCDKARDDEEQSPYFRLCDDGDPEPMIRWLRKAVAYQKKAKK